MYGQTPDPMLLTHNGVKKIAHGSPLHRLQAVFENPEVEIHAGDVRDCCNAAGEKCEAAKRLLTLIAGKLKGDKVTVPPSDVAALTDFIKDNSPAPVASPPPSYRREPAAT